MASGSKWFAMADLETMSAKRLIQEIEKRNAKDYEYLKLLIEHGYGEVTGNALDAMVKTGNAPTLVIEARKASHAYHEAQDERSRRNRYSGTDKPIKSPKIY